VLKPGPQEPWTPYRMLAAFTQAGIPPDAIAVYPGGADVGAAVLDSVDRTMIFGGQATVDRYRGNPKVQAHGPGFSKILLGDDQVDRWETYLDVMIDSVFLNSGRGCINCSGIWASRHTHEIADAIAQRLAAVAPLPPDHPDASLAAFTVPGAAEAISQAIDADLTAPGVTDVTSQRRQGPRLVKAGRADYLLPTVLHCDSPAMPAANREYMFPFVSVVECPEAKMIEAIGPTLVCTAITSNPGFQRRLLDAVHIDRLNLGPVPTIRLNWLQPHEGNLIDFLFRARAFQTADV
jgi:acyl-CoA reductase-like NAD-dependent aldehyde dehydrogenase